MPLSKRRADEAGKGFAVVAAEVKSLAVQSAKETADVSRQIAMIEEVTQRSIAEIAAANQSNAAISAGTDSLTGMVTEQARATDEIASSASSASLNAAVDALKTMQETIRGTQEAANTVRGLVGDLSARAAEIGAAMDRCQGGGAQRNYQRTRLSGADLARLIPGSALALRLDAKPFVRLDLDIPVGCGARPPAGGRDAAEGKKVRRDAGRRRIGQCPY
jgi:hypothetical protein